MNEPLLAILLLLLGLALLILEVFIPSGGLIMVTAIASLGGSVWFAYSAWYATAPSIWWTYVVGTTVSIPVSLVGAFYLLQKTPLGRRIMLEAPAPDEVVPFSAEEAHLTQLIGRPGKTLSMLNPGGLAEVDGERLHCESEGIVIDPQQPVVVVGVTGNRVIVRPATDSTPTESQDGEVLDFEFPAE
jgi:membrane-bound ClpP family serine protease